MRLTIKNFFNEMSYDLTQKEIEKLIPKYQDTIISFVKRCRFKESAQDDIDKIKDIMKSDKVIQAIENIGEKTDKLNCDMAHVLYVSTIDEEDKDLIGIMTELAYNIRYSEFEDIIKDDKLLKIMSYLSIFVMRGFEPNEFYKIKEVSAITEQLPSVLKEELGFVSMSKDLIRGIYSTLIPNLTAEQLFYGIAKTPYPELDVKNPKVSFYEIRLRSFLFQLANYMDTRKVKKLVINVCKDIERFNKVNDQENVLANYYISNRLLERLVNSGKFYDMDSDKCKGGLKLYDILSEIQNEKRYSKLF